MKINGAPYNNRSIGSSAEHLQEKTIFKEQQLQTREENVHQIKELSKAQMDDAIEKLNQTSRIFNRSLHFKLHEESKRWQVQVIDLNTGKVLREIPPRQILDLVAKLGEMVGLLVDERR